MRAVILAGGKGTRILPYTTLIPKPLMPVGGKYAILEVIIMQLKASGFNHITLAVNHFSNLIMAFFGDGSRFGVKIDYSMEEHELGTLGPLTLVQDLPDNFLVMNGDILCNLNYADFYKTHTASGCQISVSAYQRETKLEYGVITVDPRNKLVSFEEKPSYQHLVSMGIYCLSKEIIMALPKGRAYGFDQLMLNSLETNSRPRIVPFSGYWLDIGRPADYQHANESFESIAKNLGL